MTFKGALNRNNNIKGDFPPSDEAILNDFACVCII